jgi:cytochrome c5
VSYLRRVHRRFSTTPGVFVIVVATWSCLAAAEPAPERIGALFAANCAQCHLRVETTAPLAGAAPQWAERVKKGEAVLMRNLVEGIGMMPPLGYCSACTEDDLRALTRMLAGVQELPP